MGGLCAAPLLAWIVGGHFLIALALVLLTSSLAPWRRIAFAAVVTGFNWFFLDVAFFALMTLIAIAGLMRRDGPRIQLAAWACVLGFLAQIKFTYFAVSSAAVLAAMACWALRGSWGRVLSVGGGFALATAAAWLAAGQRLPNLIPYLRHSLEIALGYGDAMGVDESWPIFICGTAVALLCALFAWRAWRTIPERSFALCAPGFLAFCLFVMWKEAFTRADGHVMGFFALVLILSTVVPSLLLPERKWHWFEGVLLLCLVGLGSFNLGLLRAVPRITWERIHGNFATILRLGSLPGEWKNSYEGACEAASRPAIKAAVGNATADAYDFDTAVVLLNGLRLAPRPVFQSYTAYAPSLEEANLRWYQSGRAPDFLLWSSESLDERYPGQDDAMLIEALAGHYEPLFPEKGFWLLRRKAPLSAAPVEHRLIFSGQARLYDELVLPPVRDQAIWLRADPVPNSLGRARALAYKPALVNLVTTDDNGRQSTWRLLPRVARGGFILAPTLASGRDMELFLKGEAESWVRSFHFAAPAGQDEFWSHVDVGVFGIPGIPLRAVEKTVPLVQLGIFDRAPVSVSSAAPTQVIDIPEGKGLLVHAEGEVVFDVPAGAARLACGYGIREGAYQGAGRTDGVDFEVDAVWASGRRERLWERYLDPVAHAGDRGTQRLDLKLPADTPARLILHTGPGPQNDNRWDWSYVCLLRFAMPGEQ
jgi:hypothetical protein